MLSNFTAQFAHPQGALGRFVGTIMALKNQERNLWAISLLNLQRRDHVLEIGFGPGWAIQQIAARTTPGFVTGVDPSEVMVAQASARNAAAIRAGRVKLHHGPNAPLPYAEAHFDKVLAVNSMQFWPEALAGLQEVRRVTKPGGLVVIAIQPMWVKTGDEARLVGDELFAQLTKAGFQQVRLETLPLKPLVLSGIGVT